MTKQWHPVNVWVIFVHQYYELQKQLIYKIAIQFRVVFVGGY